MVLSDVSLSVAYIGPKSRTERPRKTKIGTEVAHFTRNSDTTFKIKRSKARSPGRFAHRRVGASGAATVGVGTCWPWETAATLPSARLRQALRYLRGRRGAVAYRGGRPPTACLYCVRTVKHSNCSCHQCNFPTI